MGLGIDIDAGPKAAIWQNLGITLDDTQSTADWQQATGMNFSVHESRVLFDASGSIQELPDKKVLWRSDTYQPLSIVGNEFKVIQPDDVLVFFKGITDKHRMKITAAGTVFDGRRFWALAETGLKTDIINGDVVTCHLLLTTTVDGTQSTVGKLINTRDYSNGTCMVAFGEAGNVIKVTHKKHLDPNTVKINMDAIATKWNAQVTNLKKMAATPMDEKATRKFFEARFFDPTKYEVDQTWGAIKNVECLTALSFGGSGSAMSAGTKWGALCGATEYFTHGNGKRDLNHQFWDSYMGAQANQKFDIYRGLVTG